MQYYPYYIFVSATTCIYYLTKIAGGDDSNRRIRNTTLRSMQISSVLTCKCIHLCNEMSSSPTGDDGGLWSSERNDHIPSETFGRHRSPGECPGGCPRGTTSSSWVFLQYHHEYNCVRDGNVVSYVYKYLYSRAHNMHINALYKYAHMWRQWFKGRQG